MKVSFVIPVYNKADYLTQCLESILNQTYEDFEVILIDDGSTDESPMICDQYANNDRVRVLHKENGGQSEARNIGVSIAKGEYVVFVDSDDFWMGEDSLKNIIEVVGDNKECDFIGFNCSYYYPSSNSYKKWVPYSSILGTALESNDVIISLVSSGTFPMSPCLKVLSREFLIKNQIYFKKGTLAEDIPWFIDLLENTNKCIFVNDYIYAYRQNVSGSVTQSNNERIYSDLIKILNDELSKIKNRNLNKDAKDALYSFYAYEFCILLSILSRHPNPTACRKELYQFKWLLNYTINPKVKIVSRIYKFCGIRITEYILGLYEKIRMSRI